MTHIPSRTAKKDLKADIVTPDMTRVRTRTVVTAVVALALGILPATAVTAAPLPQAAAGVVGAAVRPATALSSDVVSGPAAELLTLTNQARAAAGAPALRIDASLTAVAQAWSNQMAASGVMSHNPNTSAQIPAGWQSWGENVGYTKPAVASYLHDAWMASEGHKHNLLNPAFQYIGIGWAVDGSGRGWGTQVFAQYPTATALSRFADVPVDATFYDDIEWTVRAGIATGYAGGVFQPAAPVTREAMAAFLYRAVTGQAIPACGGGARRFSDVPANHPFCGAIEWLAQQGITTGYPDGGYHPGEPVSREAMAAFLFRTMNDGADPVCAAGGRRFTDVRAGDTLCGPVEWLATTGITTGWPDGTFRPWASVERQAMAAFLHRAFA